MKNYLVFILALVLLIALCACGASTTTAPETTEAPTSSTTEAVATENPLLVTAYDDPEAFVVLPDLKDINVPLKDVNEKVDKEIAALLKNLGKTALVTLTDDAVAIKGDAVNIHYTGRAKDPSVTLSEATLKGMSNASDAAGYDLILGSGSFIPGFEDQLIGAKKGDKVAVDVTFPKGYSEELSEVAVIFDVTVNAVKRATVTDTNVVALYVTYTLNGAEANGDIATFLKEHGSKLDMADSTFKLDDYFDPTPVMDAIRGKALLEEVTVDLSLTAEQAKEFGYETALSLTAKIVISDIISYPTELTDADINAYTGGVYATAKAFTDYLTTYYKVNVSYGVIMDTVTFKPIPDDVYNALYQDYYDNYIQNKVGDTSNMTEAELAAALTDAIKADAAKYAKENATAEWEDRMLMAYLQKKTGFVLTEELYKKELKELYDYYATYDPMTLYYYGITSVDTFEKAFGKDYFTFQFTTDNVLELVAQAVTYTE